jgi:DNA mismatch endonuclease (patch repair protein)
MRGNRKRDSRPELRLRVQLHARGLRYRVNRPIRACDVTVRPDIIFSRQRLAIFVDGCFWHACPQHGTKPARNKAYWGPKLTRNVARDRRVDLALANAGWKVLRFWEHEDPAVAADQVTAALRVAREGARV